MTTSNSIPPITELSWDHLTTTLRECYGSPHDAVDLLANAEDEIRRCADEASRLRVQIVALENRGHELKQFVDTCKATLAPIRKLPPEVLLLVFAAVASHLDLTKEFRHVTRVDCPGFALGAVCSYWRSLVLQTPSLWSTFRVHIMEPRFTPSARQSLRRNVEWITERSKQHPIRFSYFAGDTTLNLFREFLAPLSDRWQHICLDILYGSHWSEIEDFLSETSFPLLQSAELETLYEGTTADLFVNAPYLRRFSFLGFDGIRVPWHQLESFTVTSGYFPDFTRICHSLTQLTHLDILVEAILHDSTHLVPCILNVTELVVRFQEFPLLSKFFKSFTLPHIKSLHLRSDDPTAKPKIRQQDNLLSELTAFATRSSCQLLELKLHYTSRKHKPSFLALAAVFPSITKLELVEPTQSIQDDETLPSEFSDEFFTALSFFSPRSTRFQTLLPKLQDLTICAPSGPFNDACFVDMVKSRYRVGPPSSKFNSLKRVRLDIEDREFGASFIPCLTDFQKAGLDVSVWEESGRVI